MKLKTKILSAVCAGALVLSLPAMAFAAKSPAKDNEEPVPATGYNATVSGAAVSCEDKDVVLTPQPTDEDQVNAIVDEFKDLKEKNILVAMTVTGTNNTHEPMTFTGNLKGIDKDLEGTQVMVYIMHTDGGFDTTVANIYRGGFYEFTVDGFSTYVVTDIPAPAAGDVPADEPVVDQPSDTTPGPDPSGVSPKTGIAA